jgi:predicted transposase YbfD/YdcC
VDCKSNEIKALPPVLKALAERGVVFAFDALNTQKKLVSKSSLQKIII